ncbi:hypothetical protein J5N97_029379 [Dioscorea zingiberensis]|uniref:Uncharacterized protein n=1 Tax=Dioscorea zingiberensis TaxID=325984 RepID=A0A9D5C1K0_9LILI|nr:hypothetical protein J5N97_029379 [Dioscorea zingiberensis]
MSSSNAMYPMPLTHLQALVPPKLPLAIRAPAPRFQLLLARCSVEPMNTKDQVSAMVDELLQREENRPLLDDLDKASRRVDLAREALADIERQEAELLRAKDQILQLESRKSEIAEAQREIQKARAMMEEAQLSFSSNSYEDEGSKNEADKEQERRESLKAAAISTLVGTLASIPISLYQSTDFTQLGLHLTTAFISCALFGVTYRYTIRRDLDNIQLKTGTSAAFGFVKGLAALEAGGRPFELNLAGLLSLSTDGAICVSESVFLFLFSAIALDFCFKARLLSPFPIIKLRD